MLRRFSLARFGLVGAGTFRANVVFRMSEVGSLGLDCGLFNILHFPAFAKATDGQAGECGIPGFGIYFG